MSNRTAMAALLLVVAAVVVQTTLFVRLRPFGAAPDLVLLMVLATARHLPSEPAVLTGFTGGLLSDLLGATPLGLRALVLTVVAFTALRLRERLEASILSAALGIVLLTVGAEMLLAVVGSLFGRGLLSDALLVRKMLLTALYNLIVAMGLFPVVTLALESVRSKRWTG